MTWGAIGGAVAGTVIGGAVSSRNANKAIDAQKDQNASNAAFLAGQTQAAREDVIPLFAAGQQARELGFQGALDVFGQAIPQQLGVLQQGNVGAQQALLAGLPQVQAAILGQPVNLQQLQPQTLGIDPSFAQQQIPTFAAPPLAEERATTEATKLLASAKTNEDVLALAGAGNLPFITGEDLTFFSKMLAEQRATNDPVLGGVGILNIKKEQIPGILSRTEFSDVSNQRFSRLLEGIADINEQRLSAS